MTTPKTKSGVVGVVEHVRDKLLTHAAMVKGRPVNEATLALLPSGEQCAQLAEWLGAALAELEKAAVADRTAFDSSALVAEWEAAASLVAKLKEGENNGISMKTYYRLCDAVDAIRVAIGEVRRHSATVGTLRQNPAPEVSDV